MLDTTVVGLLFAGSVITLGVAIWLFFWMRKQYEGTEKIIGIAQAIREGAWAYLKQQYKVVIPVFILLAIIFSIMAYALGIQNPWVPFAFLSGGFFSGLAGLLGMITATQASSRVASACEKSLNQGLRIAFRSGSVMGLTVVGLVLLDIAIWVVILTYFTNDNLIVITTTMLTFGMGASTQALFARLGGGIYTKAADVGADLVGKVEEDIPEDDPRNPATIADNVGDNVGDVAGMGADLYESFAGAILATMALGAVAFHGKELLQATAISIPIMLAVVGTILSIIGIFSVRTKEDAGQKQLLGALSGGINLTTILFVVASYFIMNHWLLLENVNNFGLWLSVVVGLITGWLIGKSTEFHTNNIFRPTIKITDSAKTGPATVIITGFAVGNISTAFPILAVAGATVFAYILPAGGFALSDPAQMSIGLYGIGLAAVGMLSTLGITLATDAYGPIADNAGGLAEMGEMEEQTRHRTDLLDVLGNTTAATGKGFAIGSAALTALALLVSFIEELKIALHRAEETINGVAAMSASVLDVLAQYNVHPFNPKMLFGLFIGVGMVFLFSGLTMLSVGKAAAEMVEEARRQFNEIPGLREGTGTPDYQNCVRISTAAAQREMVFPSLLAIIVPVATGILFGIPAVIGLLIGALICGFPYAVFMANTGGAWDNAKKLVEDEGFAGEGKGSSQHKALIVGDTVGDPFKDTSGPSINILVKLMSMVSIVMVGLIAFYNIDWSALLK